MLTELTRKLMEKSFQGNYLDKNIPLINSVKVGLSSKMVLMILFLKKKVFMPNKTAGKSKYSEATICFSVPQVTIPNAGQSCDNVYKYYEEFVQACKVNSKIKYHSSYVSGYERAFMNDYESYYSPEFNQVFDANKNPLSFRRERLKDMSLLTMSFMQRVK